MYIYVRMLVREKISSLVLVSWLLLFAAACSDSDNIDGVEPSLYDSSAGLVLPSRSLDSVMEIPSSGFYENAISLTFPKSLAVHCAQGGAAPTAESAVTTSMQITSTTTIRCASFDSGTITSEELVRTYVFEKAPTIPAVFLTTDPNSLFSPDSGIYMKGNNQGGSVPEKSANYWQDKEIPVFVELMETGAESPAFAKAAGLKIHGNYSRQKKKKSVAIIFRKKYGDKRLNYSLFPEFPELNKFKGFILRNNGNNFGKDYIRDRLACSLSEGLGVDYRRGRYAIVYYNGEYYGIHDLSERSTEHYFETHYGMDSDDIDLLEADNSEASGSSKDYVAFMEWLESHSLDNEENYAYAKSKMDVDNYLNYMHTELFADNRDWPANNLKKWRNASLQTKWKWFLYDLDFGFDSGNNLSANNIFEYATDENGDAWPNGPKHTFLLRRLLENSEFKAAFVNRMEVLLQTNFKSSRILAHIKDMMAEIKQEIPRDQKRWELSSSEMDEELSIIKEFARNRASVITKELQEFFELGEVVPVTLNVDGPGRILVHNLAFEESSLTVDFFEGFPVTLYAEPKEGSVFVGWSDGETSPLRIIHPKEADVLEAVFK